MPGIPSLAVRDGALLSVAGREATLLIQDCEQVAPCGGENLLIARGKRLHLVSTGSSGNEQRKPK